MADSFARASILVSMPELSADYAATKRALRPLAGIADGSEAAREFAA
jgi:hypothetical protein